LSKSDEDGWSQTSLTAKNTTMAAIGAMFPHKLTHPGTLDVAAAAAVGNMLEIPLVTEDIGNMVDLNGRLDG
jgi:hypothetical protein